MLASGELKLFLLTNMLKLLKPFFGREALPVTCVLSGLMMMFVAAVPYIWIAIKWLGVSGTMVVFGALLVGFGAFLLDW